MSTRLASGSIGTHRARPIGPGISRLRPVPSDCRVVHEGKHLFFAGERDHDAFLVRSGNFKSYTIYADGEEQIVGLHGAGDVVGFDALFGIPAQCSVVALNTAHVQVLLMVGNMTSTDAEHGCTQLVFHAMYQELQRFTRLLHIERHPIDRRLAEFLLDFAERQSQRGMSRSLLMLPVSRRDLARYLGLAPETLSRTLTSFQTHGLIELNNREVAIVDRAGLKAMAAG